MASFFHEFFLDFLSRIGYLVPKRKIMFEYLKRRLSRLSGKITIDTYPQYYESNNLLIREDADGRRFIVDFNQNHELYVIREITNETK